MKLKSIVSKNTVGKRLLGLLLAAFCCISCESSIYSDQSDCPRGLSLRFVYDYNMEYANSFPKKVDCVSVYVFDEFGDYVATYNEIGEKLQDENYRMTINLDKGNYTLLAYGGMACNERSFYMPTFTTRAVSHIDDMYVELDHKNFQSNVLLHPLFYGKLEVGIDFDDYVEETVYLIKDTNNIRVVLQQMSGETIAASQFDFKITDDNTYLDNENNVVPRGEITYSPWVQGEEIVGSWDDAQTPVSAAWAELSTSRLTTGTSPRLTITSKANGREVLSIPLNTYLMLLKSQLYEEMSAQEYLDRESEWTLIFFLDSGLRWINTRIVINNWVVRLNHAEL